MQALSQDQLRALTHMTEGIDAGLCIGIYDGDTLQEDRTWLRDNARLVSLVSFILIGYHLCLSPTTPPPLKIFLPSPILTSLGIFLQLITNPDMLHKSVLPYHGKFMRILSNLRYVILVLYF